MKKLMLALCLAGVFAGAALAENLPYEQDNGGVDGGGGGGPRTPAIQIGSNAQGRDEAVRAAAVEAGDAEERDDRVGAWSYVLQMASRVFAGIRTQVD